MGFAQSFVSLRAFVSLRENLAANVIGRRSAGAFGIDVGGEQVDSRSVLLGPGEPPSLSELRTSRWAWSNTTDPRAATSTIQMRQSLGHAEEFDDASLLENVRRHDRRRSCSNRSAVATLVVG